MSGDSNTISFRFGRKEDYQEICNDLGLSYSEPLANMVDKFVSEPEFREEVMGHNLEEEEWQNKPYNQLPQDMQEYIADVAGGSLAELVEGDYEEAMALGEHVRKIHKPSGEMLAQVTANFLDETDTDYHI